MQEIFLSEQESLLSTLKRVKEATETDISLRISSNSPLLLNILNLKILKSVASSFEKHLTIVTDSKEGQKLIDSLENGSSSTKELSGVIEAEESLVEEPFLPKPFGLLYEGKILPFFQRLKVKGGLLASLFIGAVALLIIAFLSLFVYMPKATIKITVGSEVFVKSLEVKALTSVNEVNVKEKLTPAELLSVLEKSEKSAPTTGKKTIGEKARGRVTIYNKTDKEKIFPQGADLSYARIEGDNLHFGLDATVSVPARTLATASAEVAEEVTYVSGKTDVAITASEFGSEYNLGAGSKFKVGDLSDESFLAQNGSSFSAGSKLEVNVVSEGDQKKLEQSLKEDLKKKVGKSLNRMVFDDQKLEDAAIDFSILSTKFSQAVGDQTDTLNLSLEAKGRGLAYRTKDVEKLTKEALSDFVPSGFEIFSESREVTVRVEGMDIDKEELTLRVKVRSYVIPNIKEEEVKEALCGHSLNYAREYLDKLPNVEKYDLSIWPPVPLVVRKMPQLKEKIKVEIVRKQ